MRRDRFAKPQQDTNKKNVDSKTANDKSNLYKPSSQNLSSSLSRVDCGRYSLRTSRVPQPNSVRGVIHLYLLLNIIQFKKNVFYIILVTVVVCSQKFIIKKKMELKYTLQQSSNSK